MRIFLFNVLFLFQMNAHAFEPGVSPLGVWLVSSGDAKIEISQKGDELEGKIIWLKEPNDKSGSPKLDINNPDDDLKARPILGLVLLTGFKKEPSGGKWSGGKIYDAKSGKTYQGWIQSEAENKLKLRGYVGISLFGRTEEWTRAN